MTCFPGVCVKRAVFFDLTWFQVSVGGGLEVCGSAAGLYLSSFSSEVAGPLFPLVLGLIGDAGRE